MLPASIPVDVTLGPSEIARPVSVTDVLPTVKPVALKEAVLPSVTVPSPTVVSPTVTLLKLGFSSNLTVMVELPSVSCDISVVILSVEYVCSLTASVPTTLTVLPNAFVTTAEVAAVSALAFAPNFKPPEVNAVDAAFNCATFTASVSYVPAATPVIWRVTVAVSLSVADAPTAMALCVARHAGSVF